MATLSLPDLNWLIRVDVSVDAHGSFARYARTDEHGNVESYTVPIGPDTNDIGLSAIAIVDLIRDLNFAEVDGAVHVAHAGSIGQEAFGDILVAVAPAYVLARLCTSATVN